MMILDMSKEYQPYFVEYIKQNNLKDGVEIYSYEYIAWIKDKHSEYAKLTGTQYYTSEEFLQWLKQAK